MRQRVLVFGVALAGLLVVPVCHPIENQPHR
jgi:hypothetical protein